MSPRARSIEPSNAATLMQVAEAAGVSVATASRALNGGIRKVRPELKERVLAVAAELNYTPNANAQAMVRGRTNVVGLLVHDIADPYFGAIASGVTRAAEELGMLVTLADTGRRPQRQLEFVDLFRSQRSRAVIMAGSQSDDPELEAQLKGAIASFEHSGGRVVAIGQHRFPVDTLVIDNFQGAHDLGTELLRLGYRKFAILSGPESLLAAHDRVQGFTEALAANPEAAKPIVLHGPFTRDGGYESMIELIDSGAEFDCVFACTDVMAMGAMSACRERNVAMPEQVGMAGFDDIHTLQDLHPQLTTVRLPLVDLGERAVNRLKQAGAATPTIDVVLGEVVVRASTPGVTAG